MIAQNDGQSTSVLKGPTQNIERGWAAIDEIANEPQGITIPVPLDAPEQPLQGQPAAVNVTNSPGRHPSTLHVARSSNPIPFPFPFPFPFPMEVKGKE